MWWHTTEIIVTMTTDAARLPLLKRRFSRKPINLEELKAVNHTDATRNVIIEKVIELDPERPDKVNIPDVRRVVCEGRHIQIGCRIPKKKKRAGWSLCRLFLATVFYGLSFSIRAAILVSGRFFSEPGSG